MLMLRRAVGQSIHIADDIVVVVKSITPTDVVLGVEAPRNISVARNELVKRKPNREHANRKEQ